MEDESMKKIAEHEILVKEIPTLRNSIHKQEVTNEKILNKIDGLYNALGSMNNRLDRMEKQLSEEVEKGKISWVNSIKNALMKSFEVGIGVLIALACANGKLF